MKALVLAVAIAALSYSAKAGAPLERAQSADKATVAVMADAGRLSAASLSPLTDAQPWAGSHRSSGRGDDFEALTQDLAPGHLIVALCVLGFALSRPISRLLRRHEQQRRANALASTLGHGPK
ncbi:MAG: hypothetical protein EON93_07440 [Burkholderiales bacterium]|nr:MAG: hypothetical protein EON93_07440 [Burkholderiales bacterium]